MSYVVLIRRRFHHAFEDGCRIKTYGGIGIIRRHRVADLVLPSGELTLGYPGNSAINVPSDVHPKVTPGQYAVDVSVAEHPEGHTSFAFLTIRFTDEPVVQWKSAGHFFTDTGTGCVVDRSAAPLLQADPVDPESVNEWRWVREDPSHRGRTASIVLDVQTRANAILFRVYDGSYDCFTGLGRSGRHACLIIDGRRLRWWEELGFWW